MKTKKEIEEWYTKSYLNSFPNDILSWLEGFIKELDVSYPDECENYNDVWKIISLLEHFGYPSYTWDSVLYTFNMRINDSRNIDIEEDGITFNQAVCRGLVSFSKKYFEANE